MPGNTVCLCNYCCLHSYTFSPRLNLIICGFSDLFIFSSIGNEKMHAFSEMAITRDMIADVKTDDINHKYISRIKYANVLQTESIA